MLISGYELSPYMRIWYDPSATEHVAAWFTEHANIQFDQWDDQAIPEIGRILANLTPELIPLLPLIRHGRPDLIVQVTEEDLEQEYGSDWELHQVLLVAEGLITSRKLRRSFFYAEIATFLIETKVY